MTNDPAAQLADLLAAELEAAQERWVKEVMKVEFEFANKGTFNGSASCITPQNVLPRGSCSIANAFSTDGPPTFVLAYLIYRPMNVRPSKRSVCRHWTRPSPARWINFRAGKCRG
jgi:hypothetical protein